MDDVSETQAVIQKHRDEIMRIPGVQGIAVRSESPYGRKHTPGILIYVNKNCKTERVPEFLEGIRVFLIRSVEGPPSN